MILLIKPKTKYLVSETPKYILAAWRRTAKRYWLHRIRVWLLALMPRYFCTVSAATTSNFSFTDSVGQKPKSWEGSIRGFIKQYYY